MPVALSLNISWILCACYWKYFCSLVISAVCLGFHVGALVASASKFGNLSPFPHWKPGHKSAGGPCLERDIKLRGRLEPLCPQGCCRGRQWIWVSLGYVIRHFPVVISLGAGGGGGGRTMVSLHSASTSSEFSSAFPRNGSNKFLGFHRFLSSCDFSPLTCYLLSVWAFSSSTMLTMFTSASYSFYFTKEPTLEISINLYSFVSPVGF